MVILKINVQQKNKQAWLLKETPLWQMLETTLNKH
jgi:hypothetical protein